MQGLEKVLEEIAQLRRKASENGNFNVAAAYESSMEIICKHLSRENDTEITRSSLDKWIPVEERMPETNKKVGVTFREWMEYLKKYRYGRCNAVYIPKHSVEADDIWAYENDDCVEYDEKTDTLYMAEGWYETIEHWGDYSHCYINCDVIAWRPLPEPYKPESN